METLAHDQPGAMGLDPSVPVAQAARLTIPVLVRYGTASPPERWTM
jgi:hypothetical protein